MCLFCNYNNYVIICTCDIFLVGGVMELISILIVLWEGGLPTNVIQSALIHVQMNIMKIISDHLL